MSGATFGGAVGIDGELTGLPVVLGGAASFSRSELDNDGYNASTATNYGALSLYGLYQAGPAYVSAITTLGYGRTSFDRNLQGLGLNLSTSVDLDGTLFGGRVEAGYRMPVGKTVANVTPFAAFQPVTLWLGSGSESFGNWVRGSTTTLRP